MVSGSVKEGQVDANGIPCISHAADQKSCAELAHTPHQTHYAFCIVGKANSVTCPEPEVEAHDHHEGSIRVTKKVKLFVRSDPHKLPEVADVEVTALDYNQRGEYTLIYDAMDSSGNAADTVIFHMFFVGKLVLFLAQCWIVALTTRDSCRSYPPHDHSPHYRHGLQV
jgi:hypothetical protein